MVQCIKGGNLAKKHGPLETRQINADDYDIIYATGYEDCLLDCKTQLTDLVEQIESDDLDALEVLKGFVQGMEDAMGKAGTTQ
jgi:hypothetical protein